MTSSIENSDSGTWKVWQQVQGNRVPLKTNKFYQKIHLDPWLLLLIFCLFGLSLLILYSAKLDVLIVKKQAIRLGVAALIMFIVAQIPVRVLQSFAALIYFSSLVMLILVLVIGYTSKGAQRWLDLGLMRFQPAEFMKIGVPLMVATYLKNQVLPPNFKVVMVSLILILIPATLTAMQPDLGTAILIASSGCLVLFFAGLSWRSIIIFALLLVISAPAMWFGMHDYQRKRVITLINPEQDPLGSGYHIIQSKIAIGSGGLYGKGWLNGTQSQLEFLPERTTDFIFAVYAEEFGFAGVLLLLLIYLFIIFRGLYIGITASDSFSKLLSGSLVMTFFIYVFVNIGMVNGILPVVGIPLPLISYGGTSLVTIMIGFGIIMSIYTNKKLF